VESGLGFEEDVEVTEKIWSPLTHSNIQKNIEPCGDPSKKQENFDAPFTAQPI